MDHDEKLRLEARIAEIEHRIESAEGADRAELEAHLEAALRKLREADFDAGASGGADDDEDGDAFDNMPV